MALLWDERRGWSAVVERLSGVDLIVVADMGAAVLPIPDAVAGWMRGVRRGEHRVMHRAVASVTTDVTRQLVGYPQTPWVPAQRNA